MSLVAARFADRERSRVAIEALEGSGVDGGDIRLVGNADEHVLLSESETRTVDRRVTRTLARRIALGAVAGAAIGAAAGLVITAALLTTTDVASGAAALVVSELIGVWIGGTAGAFVGLARAGTYSAAWSRTFEDLPPGPVWVGVRCHDDRMYAHVLAIFEHQHALEIKGDGPGAR